MSNSQGVISAPVDAMRDVAAVLGESSGDIGTLCKSSAINIWAKNKPYRDSQPYTSAARRQAATHGVSLPAYTLSQMRAASRAWQALPPRGAAYNEPFRLLDFNGYDHGASAPSFVFSLPYVSNNRGAEAFFGQFSDGADLQMSDLKSNTLASGIDTDYPSPPYPLSEFYVMFVVFAGNTVHVYNTGVKIPNATGIFADFADDAFADVPTGADVLALACLALTDYLSVGDTKLNISGTDAGFYSNTLFIPLNFVGREAEKTMQVVHWDVFTNLAIASAVLRYPSTGYIQWKVPELVLGCDGIGTSATSFHFWVRLYIYRNGQLVPGGNPYPSYDEILTPAYIPDMGRYYFNFTANFLASWPGFVPETDTAMMEIEYDGNIVLSTDVTRFIVGPRIN